MSSIFLSYAREDQKIVDRVYDGLRASGHRPWMDTRDLVAGEQWQKAIARAIKASDFFVVCMSAHSRTKRGYLQKEIALAFDIWQEKLASDIYLIPLKLDDTVPDERLASFQWIDWNQRTGIRPLLKAIQVGVARASGGVSAEAPPLDETTSDISAHDIVVLKMHPTLNASDGERLLNAGRMLLAERNTDVVLDCSATVTANSMGISCLIDLIELVIDRGGAIAAFGMTPMILKTFSIMGLSNYMPLSSDIGSAVAALHRARPKSELEGDTGA